MDWRRALNCLSETEILRLLTLSGSILLDSPEVEDPVQALVLSRSAVSGPPRSSTLDDVERWRRRQLVLLMTSRRFAATRCSSGPSFFVLGAALPGLGPLVAERWVGLGQPPPAGRDFLHQVSVS